MEPVRPVSANRQDFSLSPLLEMGKKVKHSRVCWDHAWGWGETAQQVTGLGKGQSFASACHLSGKVLMMLISQPLPGAVRAGEAVLSGRRNEAYPSLGKVGEMRGRKEKESRCYDPCT